MQGLSRSGFTTTTTPQDTARTPIVRGYVTVNSALVTAVLTERALCVECIAQAMSTSRETAEVVLTVLQRVVEVHREDSTPCHLCEATTTVFRMIRIDKRTATLVVDFDMLG